MKEDYATVQIELEALHPRALRMRLPEGFSRVLFVRQGNLICGEEQRVIEGPALCFWPASVDPSVTLEAGASAGVLGLSEALILDAIGARAESVHLRMLAENPFVIPANEPRVFGQITALFQWFADELSREELRSEMSLAAYLRLLLICALRFQPPGAENPGIEPTSLLRRFRHLVELHYRDHWQVTKYAEELAIDYDRLNRICKRETGRSPAELVHERLTAEAKARLENTGHPLKQIASDLGFTDATRFSHFFKRRTDMSPGAYRAIVSRPNEEAISELRRGFSDWP